MFISSESVINFYGLNLTRLCVYECVHSVFMGFKWSFNYFSTFAYINNEGTSFCLVIYQSVSILCYIVYIGRTNHFWDTLVCEERIIYNYI